MGIPPFVFGRTQSAFGTPFESVPERANGFVSKTVQEAIEEALTLAVANDRFPILADYNGNASNRWLEIWPGISSDEGFIQVFTQTKLLSITILASAVSSGSIGVFDLVQSTTVPLYSLSYGGAAFAYATSLPSSPLANIPINGRIAIKAITAATNKPRVLAFFSSSL